MNRTLRIATLVIALLSLGAVAVAVAQASRESTMPFATFAKPSTTFQFAINGVVPSAGNPLLLAAAAADALATGEARAYSIVRTSTTKVSILVNTTFNAATGDVTYTVMKNGAAVPGAAITVTAGATNNIGVLDVAGAFTFGDLIGVRAFGATGVGVSRGLIAVELN